MGRRKKKKKIKRNATSNIDNLFLKLRRARKDNIKRILKRIKLQPFDILLTRYKELEKYFAEEKYLFPRSYEDIASSRYTPATDSLTKELHWAMLPMFKYISEINAFCESKKRFDIAFLKGDVESAEKEYSEIIDHFGLSLWSIDAGFLLNSYGKILQNNREFLEQIKRSSNDIALINVYAENISMRIEANVSNYVFNRRIQQLCDTKGVDDI